MWLQSHTVGRSARGSALVSRGICSGMYVPAVCRLASHNSTNIANSFWWAKTQLILDRRNFSSWQGHQGQNFLVLGIINRCVIAHQRIHYQFSAAMSLYSINTPPMTHLTLKVLRQVSLHIWPRCSVAFAFMSKTWCQHDRVLRLRSECCVSRTACLYCQTWVIPPVWEGTQDMTKEK